MPRRRSRSLRSEICFFHLPENFSLAEHHAFQTAYDAEEVPDALRSMQLLKCGRITDSLCQNRQRSRSIFAGDVVFHAIAGGDNHRFANLGLTSDLHRSLANMRVTDSELLTKFDRRVLMAEAKTDDVHH